MQEKQGSPIWQSFLIFGVINSILPLFFYIFHLNNLLSIAKKNASLSDGFILLSYIFSLTFIFSIVLFALFLPLLYLIKNNIIKKFLYLLIVLLETMSLIYFLVNNMVYQFLGIHLDSSFVFDAMLNSNVNKETQFGASTFAILFLYALFFFLLQWFLLWLSKKVLIYFNLSHRVPSWLAVIVVIFGFISVTNSLYFLKKAQKKDDPIIRAFPLYQRLFGTSTKMIQLEVRYPRGQALSSTPKIKKRKNIIFILAESLRSDTMYPEQMPNITRYQKQHSCIISQHHYSGAHCTTWGIFSVLYGLYSYHFKFFHDKNVRSYPIQVLHQNGYSTTGLTASLLKGWDHGGLFAQQFDKYREFKKLKSYQNDAILVKKVAEFNKKRDPNKPFFLFLFLDSSHHNYLYPKKFEKYKPVMPENYNHFMANQKLRKFRTKIVNRYKNSVLYVDHLFGRLMKIFKKDIDRDNLIVAFSGDHGEEFWDHGLLGHGAPRFIKARTQVPLLFCLPKIKTKKVNISSHADLWPTIMDYLDLSPKIPRTDYSNGSSLLRPQAKDRYAVITSYGYPYRRRLLAQINNKHKFWLKWRERFNHFKLLKMTDLEDNNVLPTQATESHLYIKRLEWDMMRFFNEKKFIFTNPPKMQFTAELTFGHYLQLVGFSVDKTTVARGSKIHFSYLFKALKTIPKKWKLFFHLELVHPKRFHNLRHTPLGGSYPLHQWKTTQYIQDEHWIQIPYKFPKTGKLRLYIGMWAKGEKRQPVHLGKTHFNVTKTRRLLLKEFTLSPNHQ